MKRTKKQKTPAKKAVPKKSAIIAQCVVYAQSIGAYHAGFKVDHTADLVHAGALGGECEKRAAGAVRKLICLSPAFTSGKPPLSREELLAKAGVLGIMNDHSRGVLNPEPDEEAFVRFFAREVADYLEAELASS